MKKNGKEVDRKRTRKKNFKASEITNYDRNIKCAFYRLSNGMEMTPPKNYNFLPNSHWDYKK